MQQVQSPIDDVTYDVIASLHETLEAIETYQRYLEDDPSGEAGTLFKQLADEHADQARRLMDLLRARL